MQKYLDMYEEMLRAGTTSLLRWFRVYIWFNWRQSIMWQLNHGAAIRPTHH